MSYHGSGPYKFFLSLFRGYYVKNETLNILYGGLGALVFSMYLIYDIHLICGGKHRKYQLSPDEYIFGAIAIYLDIINLFLDLLMLFGKRKD